MSNFEQIRKRFPKIKKGKTVLYKGQLWRVMDATAIGHLKLRAQPDVIYVHPHDVQTEITGHHHDAITFIDGIVEQAIGAGVVSESTETDTQAEEIVAIMRNLIVAMRATVNTMGKAQS